MEVEVEVAPRVDGVIRGRKLEGDKEGVTKQRGSSSSSSCSSRSGGSADGITAPGQLRQGPSDLAASADAAAAVPPPPPPPPLPAPALPLVVVLPPPPPPLAAAAPLPAEVLRGSAVSRD
ncbi:hypothetical protein Vafri_14051 [Volvox africanus]|uniref:Uncharacterized protein n=1 Tax=Volvox africanus TaxID=51714 RepID=A0A8J4BD98_9CHLO|nr:hypothetical protein Vafri_14051 [Volvox africanus]